jgi:GT2 family glycosyltransferase
VSVAAVVVSHAGVRWLPAVLDGLRAQTVPPAQVVAVDTGSKDDSAALLTDALGAERLVTTGRQTSFPEAVDLALDRLTELGAEPTWIWLLHDDANPAPTALAELLAAAGEHPHADVLGPKLREWPSLRRLVEVGVTISATGRRETGLERAEYDQGQHDDVRRVLAVNTAGMLVRLDLLRELGGFDRQLPIFGNDLDFGWRAAAAGRTTLVVPQAVVFHAEAAHRGARRTPLTGRHTHYQERRAALYTLLVNGPARSLPLRVVRLALGTVVRVLGYLAVRSVGEALDELAALVSVYARPRQILAARRSRRALARADGESAATVRALLAPWWLPYRHGLDFVSDLAAAATNQAADVAERRRAAALEQAAAEAAAAPSHSVVHTSAPVARPRTVEDDDDLPEPDSGLLTRFLTSPVALGAAVFVVAVVVGTRQAWGSVSGGALAPTPAAATDWWRLYAEHWHPLGLGTDAPAPAYLAPLAGLATLLGGSPAAAVTAVLVLAVPVALWGAWRLVRLVGRFLHPAGMPRWLVAAAAATYALVPAVSGAWENGRLGVVVVAALVPWLVHAALGFADPEPDRRWRAAWRTGLLLALVTAFGPPLFGFAVLLVVVVLGLGLLFSRGLVLDRSVSGPPLVSLAVVPLLLAPWWLPLLLGGRPGGLLLDPGRLPSAVAGFADLLLGRVDGAGAPGWLTWPVLAAAVLALVPRASRVVALACWTTALVAAATAAAVSLPTVSVLGGSVRPGATALIPVVQGAFVVAGAAGGMALLLALRGAEAAWLHRLAVVPALVALAVPAAGAVWFAVGDGEGRGDLSDAEASDIPAYMNQSSRLGPEHGVLVVRGDVDTGLDYEVLRGDGDTVGEDEVLALTPEDRAFSESLQELVSQPAPRAVDTLTTRGIEYVVLPAPADGRVAAQLDATAGLSQASAEDRATRAWLVDEPASADALDGPGSWLRVLLLVVQALGLLVVAVLCGPTWRERR